MKQCLVVLVSLALIANSNCGFLDSVLGTVTDTASSITHKVGGVLHHGKTMVFGGTEPNAAGEVVNKPGIVGTISLKIHGVSAAVREEVRHAIHVFDGDQVHDRGMFGRLFDRVRCRVFKIEDFLFGSHGQIGHTLENIRYPIKKLNNDTTSLCQKLRKYFMNNDAPAASGIRQKLHNLQEAINRAKQNIAKKRQEETANANNVEDGTGLIDIRTSVNGIGEGLQTDFEHGVDAGYDKVNDAVDEGQQTGQSYFNRAQQNTNDFIENQRRDLQNNYNQFGDSVNGFRSDVSSSINNNMENQRRNVQNSYNRMASGANTLRSDVGSSLNNNLENQRRNVQNSYNQMASGANTLRSDAGSSLNNNLENQRRNVQNSYDQMATGANSFRGDVSSTVNDYIEYERRNVQNQHNPLIYNGDRVKADAQNDLNESIGNRIVQGHYNELMANNADRFRSEVGSAVNDNVENQRRNVQNNYNQLASNANTVGSDIVSSVNNNLENQRRNVKNQYDQMATY